MQTHSISVVIFYYRNHIRETRKFSTQLPNWNFVPHKIVQLAAILQGIYLGLSSNIPLVGKSIVVNSSCKMVLNNLLSLKENFNLYTNLEGFELYSLFHKFTPYFSSLNLNYCSDAGSNLGLILANYHSNVPENNIPNLFIPSQIQWKKKWTSDQDIRWSHSHLIQSNEFDEALRVFGQYNRQYMIPPVPSRPRTPSITERMEFSI
eukprot:NODE_534_length_6366_cov_0.490825.p2 type:complete len:206 gc:universal NODE_534_length_6366_cov_0.490825:2763-3380(+)